jgi:hypothetical protein
MHRTQLAKTKKMLRRFCDAVATRREDQRKRPETGRPAPAIGPGTDVTGTDKNMFF